MNAFPTAADCLILVATDLRKGVSLEKSSQDSWRAGAAVVVVLGGGMLLSPNSIDNPISDAAGNATNAAANAALDASGIKQKADEALRDNADVIA